MRDPKKVHPAIAKMIAAQHPYKIDKYRYQTPRKFVFAIPQFNQVSLTYNCLKSLFENIEVNQLHYLECRYKVVVLDNKSTEDISILDEFTEKYPNIFSVVNLKENYKWLNTLNYAFKKYFEEEGADVIVYLNNDTLCSKNFILNYIHAFQYNLDYGVIVPYYSDSLPHQHYSSTNHLEFDTTQVKVEQIPYSDGTCFAIRKSLYDLIGGLDERFNVVGGWGADYDFCIRTKEIGYKIGLGKYLYIDHLKAQTSIVVDHDRGHFMRFFDLLNEKYGKSYQTLLYKKI